MMWRVYRTETYLDGLVGAISDTLANHCKKGVKIERSLRQAVFWFKVSPHSRGDGAVKAEGVLGSCQFIFRSGKRGASFSADHYDDVENTFRQFAIMIDFYRRDLKLEPMDFDSLYEIAGEDSPPVGADNYAPLDAADAGALQNILGKNFTAAAHREISGKYSIIVYSENAPATKYFYQKNIPVCQQFLGAFKDLYGYKDAMLVCVRKGREQYVCFYTAEKGIFCNIEDSSRSFLEQEHGILTQILSISPVKS
jgi:hypothetical protein